jgi:pimeloyl-ACP methyl ester carboxylesterase
MRAKVNGIEIAYTDAGKGVPVALFHGFPLDRSMWDAQVEALSPRARLIVPDLRGFGESTVREGATRMETFAADARALLDHLRIERAVIGGLSMGGYVAFAFYRLCPDRVQALILCDTKAAADTPEARKGRAETAELARAQGMHAIAERMLPRLLAPATFDARPETADRVRRMILRAPVAGVVGALQGMAERSDAVPLLPEIRCPVLIVVGANDVISPPAEAEAMRAKLPNGRLVVVANAGHMAPMENPGDVNAAIETFLKTVE